MAYMNQALKRSLVADAKSVLAHYGLRATFSVHNHSTLVCTIRSGRIDFGSSTVSEYWPERWKGHTSVNPYCLQNHWTGEAREALLKLREAMMKGNHDRSDSMTDYFDVGWYIRINIGTFDKPYTLE